MPSVCLSRREIITLFDQSNNVRKSRATDPVLNQLQNSSLQEETTAHLALPDEDFDFLPTTPANPINHRQLCATLLH
jgi:hypothetical protein